MAASEKDVRLFLESRRMARQLGQSSPDLFPTRAAQNEAAANRAAALKEGYESLPAPVRYGVSAARGIVDAATLGYGDEIRGGIMRRLGRPTAATVDEMMEHADRGIGEKVAGGVGYLAGTIPVAMATGAATTAGMAAAAPRLAGRAPGLARALTYLTEAAPAPASAGRVAAREALRGGATRGAAAGGLENMGRVRSAVEVMRGGGGAAGQGARQALAQGAAQNVVQGLGFSAMTEPIRDLPEGTSRAESVALNTGVGAVADALLYPVFGRFAPAATTPPRAGRRAINAIPFRYTTTPQSSAVHGSLHVPEPAPRGIETHGAPTQVEAALRRANEVSAAARLAEDEAAIQASLAQRQRMGEAPATPRVLGPQGTPARAEAPTPSIEIAPAPIRGRPIEPRRGRIAPDEPSPRFTGATLEPGSAADVAMRRARALAEPAVPEPDVDIPLRSAAEIGQRRAVELTQPDRAAREAPARSLLIPEPDPREFSLLDAQGRPLRRPVETPEPDPREFSLLDPQGRPLRYVPEPKPSEFGPRRAAPEPEPVAVEGPDVLDLSAARQRRARTEPAPESNVVPDGSPVGDAPLTLRDEAAEELASLPPKVRTIVENALGAETEQALFAEMSNLQGVRMTDQQAEIVNGLFARARERLAPKADAAPVAAATETPTASTLEAGGRRASGRATEVDGQTLLADMRALQRALPTAEADPNIRVIEVSGDAAALREAVQQAGAPERIFRIGDNEYVVLAPAEQADAVLAAARERGLAGGVGTTLDEANTAMRRGMMESHPSAPASAGRLRPPESPMGDPPTPRADTDPLQPYRDEFAAARTADAMEAVRVRVLGDTSIPHDQMVAFNREAVEAIEAKKAGITRKIDDFFSGRSQQRAERADRVRSQIDPERGGQIEIRDGDTSVRYIISRNVDQSDPEHPWRVTRLQQIDGEWTPTGHTVHRTIEGEGATPAYPEGAVQEVANNLMRGEIVPAAPRAAEALPTTRRPDAAVESRPRAASVDGQETTVRNLVGKGEARVRYRAVEASNLQASHNASTFQKNPAYPEGVQPRQYERDKNLQESVARLQQEFDPRVVTSNTALATEGPPISTPDGITLSGNSRLMAMQRIYAQGGEQAARLRQAMIDAGEQFGIPRAELEQMRQPIIDRELIDEGLDLTQRDVLRSVADRANVATTKADSPLADAATRAQRLVRAEPALRHLEQTIGPEQTVRDYLGTREGRQFVDELVAAEVISRDELSRFVDSQGVLTSDGRDLVERTLLASAVDDRGILARATENLASTVQGLTRAAPAILRARAVEGWNVQGALNEGLDIALEAKAKGMTIRDLLDQGSMFDDAQRSAHGAMMARFLDGSTQTEVKDAFRMYAREAEIARKMGETGDLFGAEPKSPAQAFDEIFGAPERMAKSKRKPCR